MRWKWNYFNRRKIWDCVQLFLYSCRPAIRHINVLLYILLQASHGILVTDSKALAVDSCESGCPPLLCLSASPTSSLLSDVFIVARRIRLDFIPQQEKLNGINRPKIANGMTFETDTALCISDATSPVQDASLFVYDNVDRVSNTVSLFYDLIK